MGLEKEHGANRAQKAQSTEYRPKKLSIEEQHALMRRAQAGDWDAWGTMWSTFERAINRHIMNIVNDFHIAEDITSTTFIKAQEKLATFECRPDASPEAWLFRIAINLSINEKTKGRRTRVTLYDPAVLDNQRSTQNPEELVIKRISKQERLEKIREVLPELKPRQREVVERRVIEDQPYVKIAEEMNTSVGNIRLLLHRGLNQIRELIEASQPA